MKKLIAATVLVLLPLGAAGAFQVITPAQMQDAGMGFTQSNSFRQQVDPNTDPNFRVQFSGNASAFGDSAGFRTTPNRWGRFDGGGRYLGDSDSNFKACSEYSDSNSAMLYNMSRGGNSYPCQRFR
ncbi:MAG: hypothetical protein AB7O49_16465 [Sphingomonadales bacterium]